MVPKASANTVASNDVSLEAESENASAPLNDSNLPTVEVVPLPTVRPTLPQPAALLPTVSGAKAPAIKEKPKAVPAVALVVPVRVKKTPVPDDSGQLTDDQVFANRVYKEYAHYQSHRHSYVVYSRIKAYNETIQLAAQTHQVDPDLLKGLIAVESAGLPNARSRANAKGLTQILSIPKDCYSWVKEHLKIKTLDLYDPQHNIWLGMKTLHSYTKEKNDDLLLGLVSYNFGPYHRGVLRAKTFNCLGSRYKSYPSKVLGYALFVKVIETYGEALPYNRENKIKIEAITLPGLPKLRKETSI
ncbi:MAG: transglycosylase SLT domain-containing protein [Candidatus Parcubacteria bacterium]|nr:transglycosylase SLT domain-containing protein [Candidatus Parcubacteria bacterium]